MRTASVREFRSNLAELIESREPVVITRHGRSKAIVYPLRDVESVPVEIRREIAAARARELGVAEDDDPVVAAFKRDVDVTLIQENLKKTPEARLRALIEMQRFVQELRRR